MTTTNQKIAKASAVLAVASFLGHGLSLVKEVLVAKFFGVTSSIDAFYSALTVTNMTGGFLLGPFTVIFIPIFIRYLHRDSQEANRLASVVVNYLLIILFTGSALCFFFAGPLIRYGFRGLDPQTAAVAVQALKVLSVTIFFTGLVGTMSGILNSFQHFLWPAFSQMFITVIIITCLLLFVGQWGIFAIVWGQTAGLAVQGVFLWLYTRKRGFDHTGTFDLDHPAFREMMSFAFVFLLLAFFTSPVPLINRIMASYLPTGSISALAYAEKLVQVPVIIFSGSLSTAIFPFFAHQIAREEMEEMNNTLASGIKVSGFVFIPLCTIMIIFARPFVQILFERGAFDAQATFVTSRVFVCYSLQMLSVYALVIVTRLLFVLQEFRILLKVAVIYLVSIVIMNYVFSRIMNPPAAGIALATSVGTVMSTLLYFRHVKKSIGFRHGASIIKSLALSSVLALGAGAVMYTLYGTLGALFSQSIPSRLSLISLSTAAGLLSFLLAAHVMKNEELRRLLGLVRSVRSGKRAG